MNITISQNGTEEFVALEGRLDTLTAPDLEKELNPLDGVGSLCIDCKDLEYISSAGLRVLLRLRKDVPGLKAVNVSSEVYEIL